ncbi:MAG: hypothetical protein ACXAD7_04535 [Candidatus Kariarchaeaceae archaeon]|jgi:epoxyqueuosine reductase QueG
MLNEKKQIQLSQIVPFGTADTIQQKKLRDMIQQQKRDLEGVMDSPIAKPSEISIALWQQKMSDIMKSWNVISYGVAPLLKQHSYQNSRINAKEHRVIVFAIPMDYQKVKSVPSVESATEVLNAYHRCGEIVIKLTTLLRDTGIQATGHHPLGDNKEYHQLLFPPHAEAAGMGEKGRTGLFIDHQLGPLVRLGIVTTSLDLPIANIRRKGVNAFCHRCRYCVGFCPTKAINPSKYLESLKSGVPIQFKINGNSCLKYFTKHFGCGICLVKCVLTQANQEEIAKRMQRIENWYNRWVVTGDIEKIRQEAL